MIIIVGTHTNTHNKLARHKQQQSTMKTDSKDVVDVVMMKNKNRSNNNNNNNNKRISKEI